MKKGMQWIAAAFLLSLTIFFVGCGSSTLESPAAESETVNDFQSFTATVVRVPDGDGLIVKANGKQVELRLNSADCRETSQPFGVEAWYFVETNLLNQEVKVSPKEREKYGRLLADVQIVNGEHAGKDLAEVLISQGLARWYEYFAPQASNLAQLEFQARSEKKGLWAKFQSAPNQILPSAYRQWAKDTGAWKESSRGLLVKTAGMPYAEYLPSDERSRLQDKEYLPKKEYDRTVKKAYTLFLKQ